MGRRSGFLLIILGGLILIGTVNSAWNSRRDRLLELGPPTAKPAANFVPLRPVGDVSMPLRATSDDGSAFTSSAIVTSPGHPSGVAYLAGWQEGANLRVGSLDLASGARVFPVVDLGTWKQVYQLAARPEGILIAGLQPRPSPRPALPGVPVQLDVCFVALDPVTGRVRWEARVRSGRQLAARLYPDGVLAETGAGRPALLDWTTGAPRWTLSDTPSQPSYLDNALPVVSWVEPQLSAPLGAAAQVNTSTPGDPRLALRTGRSWILDTRTGDRTVLTTFMAHNSTSHPTSLLVIGESVFLSVTIGRSGDVLYQFPADPQYRVDSDDVLWSERGSIRGITLCGPHRLCLTEVPFSNPTGQRMVLIDTQSRRLRTLPDTVPTGGYAIGDRYVDPLGRVYDFAGVPLGATSPLLNAWWLTPGSLVGIDRGDPARAVGITPHTSIVSVSTVDGRRSVLGPLPSVPIHATTGNGYLVYADSGGFHAIQYAQP